MPKRISIDNYFTVDDKTPPPTLTVPEVAKILRLRSPSVRAAIKRGDIPAQKIGGKYLISRSWINNLIGGE